MSPIEQYIAIIHNRQQNPLTERGEVHHIIPKSCGGCDKEWNKVNLSCLEHIECHRLLTKIYPTGKEHKAMATAYALMCTSRDGVKVSPEEAAEARQMMAESKKGRPTWMKGRYHTEESKRKQREIKLGKRPSAETRKKMGDAHRGKHYGAGKVPWNKGKTYKTGKPAWNKGLPGHPSWNKGMKMPPRSEEYRQRCREAALRRWAKVKA